MVRDDDGKYHCNCLRLNNNNITNLTAMAPALKQLFDQPFAFTWVDLSFNELTAIDPVNLVIMLHLFLASILNIPIRFIIINYPS